MRATEETQELWVKVMGFNPSNFQEEDHCEGDEYKEIDTGVSLIPACRYHPVENVSWWSVLVYANRLSEMSGLDPVYDLSGVTFEGEAKKGTLRAIGGELKINASDGDLYKTNGFRLPTESEWEYVSRAGTITVFNLGDNISPDQVNYNNGEYPYRDAPKGLYRGRTVSVGSLPNANGWGFLDMHGNVYEWVYDWFGGYPSGTQLDPAVNPVGPDFGSFRVVRGGSWWSFAEHLRSANRSGNPPGYEDRGVGFRLVKNL